MNGDWSSTDKQRVFGSLEELKVSCENLKGAAEVLRTKISNLDTRMEKQERAYENFISTRYQNCPMQDRMEAVTKMGLSLNNDVAKVKQDVDVLEQAMAKINRVEDLIKGVEEKHSLSIDNIARATTLARESMEKRLDTMNEFRDALRDQSAQMVTRNEYAVAHERMAEEMKSLMGSMSKAISVEQLEAVTLRFDDKLESIQKAHDERWMSSTARFEDVVDQNRQSISDLRKDFNDFKEVSFSKVVTDIAKINTKLYAAWAILSPTTLATIIVIIYYATRGH